MRPSGRCRPAGTSILTLDAISQQKIKCGKVVFLRKVIDEISAVDSV